MAEGVPNKDKDICPIIEISCLVSSQNVYFNIQEETKPENVNFDIEDEKLWKPFVTERTRNELFEKGNIETIQNTIGQEFYTETNKLQSSIEVELKQFIRENLQK